MYNFLSQIYYKIFLIALISYTTYPMEKSSETACESALEKLASRSKKNRIELQSFERKRTRRTFFKNQSEKQNDNISSSSEPHGSVLDNQTLIEQREQEEIVARELLTAIFLNNINQESQEVENEEDPGANEIIYETDTDSITTDANEDQPTPNCLSSLPIPQRVRDISSRASQAIIVFIFGGQKG